MKRRRRSCCQYGKSRERQEISEDNDTVIQSRFETDIRADIFTDIMVRLPVRSILACRCVCKTWRQRILDPEFAESHSKRAQQSIILRIYNQNHVSRTLYLLEPQNYRFEDTCLDEFCSKEHIGMILDTKLKIPLRDHTLRLSGRLEALAKANSKGNKGKRLVATKPVEDYYCIVNSCNGLLCLSEPEENNPVVVCNPVTGEYTQLMGSSNLHEYVQKVDETYSKSMIGGFGFCPSTNQYKVVRLYIKYGRRMAEVQTLGSGSWKEVTIGYAPRSYRGLKYPSYMSGKVHWLSAGGTGLAEIFLFNMENDQFGSVALPSCDPTIEWTHNTTTMGVLYNRICICQIYHYLDQFLIWLMNDNGATSTWELAYSIENEDRWPYTGHFYPMKLYENGAVLIFHTYSGLIYHDPKECGLKYFRIQEGKLDFRAITYVPSFISLEKQIIGDVVVQNVISRCAQFKLREEKLEVYLRKSYIHEA